MIASATPRVVVLKEGAESARSTVVPQGAPEAATPDVVTTDRSRRLFFPDDLYGRGARRPELRTRAEILQQALASPAQPGEPDTLRLAIFRIDFLQNSAVDSVTGDGRFDLRPGPAGVLVDPPPHDKRYFEAHAEALRRFYDVQSYGSLVIEPIVFPAETDSAYHLGDTGDYGPWEVEQDVEIIAKAEAFVGDAIAAVDASGDVDFTSFDAFVVVHAGADRQGDVERDTPYDIPSFTITLEDSLIVNGGAARVGRVLVLPESPSQDERLAALNGVFAHEFGHVLGLPDLYNIYNGYPQVGYWSLMDSGENIRAIVEDPDTGEEFEAEGIFPTSLDPWCKLQVFESAVACSLVQEVWQGTLEGTQVNPFLPQVTIDALEYFLVENRALDLDGNGFPFVLQDSTTGVFMGPVDDPDNPGAGGRFEYDAVLPGGGIAIWHIDDRLAATAPGGAINFDIGFRGVAIEEADGVWDQGRINLGRPDDLFFLSNNSLFGPGTIPGSEANDGSYSGVTIEITSEPDRLMGVRVERALAHAGWPAYVRQDSDVFVRPGPMCLTDLSGDGVPEFVFGAAIDIVGQQLPTFGLFALEADGTPYVAPGDTADFGLELPGVIQPRVVTSDHFRLRAGDPAESTVVAGVSGDRAYLWNAAGQDLLGTSGSGLVAPAATPPVLVHRDADPGWVLYAGPGAIHARTVPGNLAYSAGATLAVDKDPTAGPTLIPDVERSFGDVAVLLPMVAAVGFDGGIVEFFSLGGISDPVPGPVVFSSQVVHLVSGVVEMSEGAGASLVAVTEDSVAVIAPGTGEIQSAWPLANGVTVSPVLGDVDGDDRSEIVLADTSGLLAVYNADGSYALGWPRQIAGPARDLALVDLDGDGTINVMALDADGRFHGWNDRGEVLPTFPRPLGPFNIASSWIGDLDGDGRLNWAATTDEGVLQAVRFPGAEDRVGDWKVPGKIPEGGNHQTEPATSSPREDRPALDGEPLLVYPNPARGSGVEIRFVLRSGESAAVELLDLAGRPLTDARLDTRGGFKVGENAVRWEIDDVAPGLYFCRLERDGPAGTTVDMAKIVVLR